MREMKDSGIAWIGMIPVAWKMERVKHCFYRKNEKAMQDAPIVLSLARSGVRVRDISNNEGQIAESYYNYNPVDIDDLLLNPMDLYSGANCSISKVKGVISPAYVNLRAFDGINPVYYDYYFKVQYWLMAFFSYGKGVSYENRWTLTTDTLMNYPVVVPSDEEQCRIADYLDEKCSKIDGIIAKKEQIIDKLRAYRKAVISEVVARGMTDNPQMVDSGVSWIGEIPQNWTVGKLGDLFDFLGGYAFSSDDYVPETEFQVVRIGNVKNNYMPLDSNPVFITEKTAEDAAKFEIKEGFILFTMTGTKGKRDYFFTHMVRNADLENRHLYVNQRVGAFIAHKNVHPGYYNYLLKDERILDSIFIYETGTANQGNLGIDSIRRTRVQIPPLEEQVEIADYLDKKCFSIDSEIDKKQILIDKLHEYKKSLIYEVTTGKKEV